jgi:hypothetical protein
MTERAYLITYFEEFGELFTNNTTKNPTPKMHSLFPHVEACLKKYGTVGLFAEDYIEVIHALVNSIVTGFQYLDEKSQTKQVLRFFVGREYSRHERTEGRNGKKRGYDCQRKYSQGCEEKATGNGCP